MTTKALGLLFGLCLVHVVSACSECAGVASCHVQPALSYSGEFISHKTGRAVAGVTVTFIRRSGIPLDSDTLSAMTDDHGFFNIRGTSALDGAVVGDLQVTPPAPSPSFTMAGVRMSTSRRRGDGGYLGRLVIDPYLLIIGELHDQQTGALVPFASVRLVRLAGGRVDPDTMDFVTAADGRFVWIEPPVRAIAPIDAEFEIRVPDDSTVFRVRQQVPLVYQDATFAFVLLEIAR